MNYYLAPMEGLTGYLYRNALKEFFTFPDKCFTPFIAPNQKRCLGAREKRDVDPEHNRGMYTVPQILTNRAEDFICTCRELEELGYREVNLNLGCPSGTVAAKKRGAGFLGEPKELDAFLDRIFAGTGLRISIKTRLGVEEPEEFYPILAIYNKYPLHELIIHPRVQKDFYKNKPRMEVFGEALAKSPHKICYNGDLFTQGDLEAFEQAYPQVKTVMIGRGFLVNPGFLDERAGKWVTAERLYDFHEKLLSGYERELSGEIPVLFKMKELWFYMIRLFSDSEREAKKLRKAQRLWEYREIVNKLFREKEIVPPKRLYF